MADKAEKHAFLKHSKTNLSPKLNSQLFFFKKSYIFNTIDSILQIDIKTLSAIINPLNIKFSSWISNNRFSTFLANKNIIDEIINKCLIITVNNHNIYVTHTQTGKSIKANNIFIRIKYKHLFDTSKKK